MVVICIKGSTANIVIKNLFKSSRYGDTKYLSGKNPSLPIDIESQRDLNGCFAD